MCPRRATGHIDARFEQLLAEEQRWTASGPSSPVSLHALLLTVLVRTFRGRLRATSLLELTGGRRGPALVLLVCMLVGSQIVAPAPIQNCVEYEIFLRKSEN